MAKWSGNGPAPKTFKARFLNTPYTIFIAHPIDSELRKPTDKTLPFFSCMAQGSRCTCLPCGRPPSILVSANSLETQSFHEIVSKVDNHETASVSSLLLSQGAMAPSYLVPLSREPTLVRRWPSRQLFGNLSLLTRSSQNCKLAKLQKDLEKSG